MKTPKIKALIKQIESGKMNTDKAYILKEIKHWTEQNVGLTIISISKDINLPTSTIVARLSDLEDLGVIYKNGSVYSELLNSSFSLFYYESNPDKWEERRILKHSEKYIRYVKKLLNSFNDDLHPELKKQLKKSLELHEKLFKSD